MVETEGVNRWGRCWKDKVKGPEEPLTRSRAPRLLVIYIF